MNFGLDLGVAGAVILDVAYGPGPAHRLDIYRPAAPAAGRPAILMFHGGAWRAGDKSRFAVAAAKFAAAGILAVSANYRLVDAAVPGTGWPAQLHDSEAALAWLKDHAAGLDADPAAITVMGVSAGGHLALFAGLAMTVSGEARAPLAAGVISLGGPADLRAMHAVRPGMIEGLLASDAHRGFDDAAGAASPCSYVVPGAAPVLLLHGISDPAVPFGAALAYLSALLGAHVPAWLLTHPGGHLVNGASPALRGELMAAQIDFVQRRRLDRSPGRHDLGGS